jgi:hypothetical protein
VASRGLLTQAILRDRLPHARAAATRRCTEAILAASDPGDPPEPGTWARWTQLMPHLLAADLAATDNPALRELVRRACWYLIERGDARTARDLMSNLRQGWDLAARHRAVIVILNRPGFGGDDVPPVFQSRVAG